MHQPASTVTTSMLTDMKITATGVTKHLPGQLGAARPCE